MITSRLKVYYQYDGPCKADPFRKQLSQSEVEENLRRFPGELKHILWETDFEPQVALEHSNPESREIIVAIQSDLSRKDYDGALKRALNGLDLFGEYQEFVEK